MGIAGIALRAGAKSSVATLWPVIDQGAALTITELYGQLKIPGISKAQAVQNTQKLMIKHPDFNHPAFWAAFVLIGSSI
ncbi:CHAT domain-containing protein [Desulfonema limicola]|uniref:CHAT domain-containing protein n=1 Tax=Desulfonema limicola TaxID=45656 RepID=A0A975GHG7_9BACT|nr:CHAT domain-containing protein [Desulfonema limicola]QTA81431.1 CHAT domain-containing protein [Desulfonema limicola]